DAYLDLAMTYEMENGLSLAGFLHWFNAGETDVKREMDKNAGEVRIMTVHAAKGLEGNIVFLPDAASLPRGRSASRLLKIETQNRGLGLPLWNLSGLTSSPALELVLANNQAKIDAERNRLLYVAMTRARDELYICGAKSKSREIPKTCWYALVEPILGVTEPSVYLSDAQNLGVQQTKEAFTLPSWILHPAKSESAIESQTVTHALKAKTLANTPEMQRGTAIHAILQALPRLAPNRRRAFASVKAKQHGLDEADVLNLVDLLARPELTAFLGSDSMSEVEICGTLENGKTMTGRLDRIVIEPTQILLLDFKTDVNVPSKTSEDHVYLRQMQMYSQLMREAYPTHKIKAALLWTQTGKLEWLFQ
ncbi:MAG: PD-(D/E)XK nuclease family protein, partial [Alphaproteobacteria bacterium]|nr:PD-(D/E)XK nuclease family protein [Alphaproteobacteria bacterium]